MTHCHLNCFMGFACLQPGLASLHPWSASARHSEPPQPRAKGSVSWIADLSACRNYWFSEGTASSKLERYVHALVTTSDCQDDFAQCWPSCMDERFRIHVQTERCLNFGTSAAQIYNLQELDVREQSTHPPIGPSGHQGLDRRGRQNGRAAQAASLPLSSLSLCPQLFAPSVSVGAGACGKELHVASRKPPERTKIAKKQTAEDAPLFFRQCGSGQCACLPLLSGLAIH